MTTPARSAGTTPAATPATATVATGRPKAPAAPPAPVTPAKPASPFGADTFTTAPTKAELDAARAAVAALKQLPAVPALGKEAQRAWIANAEAKLATAKQGLEAISDGEFFHHVVSQEEASAARDLVYDVEDKIRNAKEAAGVTPPTKPAGPFRPLFELTKSLESGMGNHPLLALLGIMVLPVAYVVDLMDLITRPVQAIAYPFRWGVFKWREHNYNAEHPAPATTK